MTFLNCVTTLFIIIFDTNVWSLYYQEIKIYEVSLDYPK